MLPEVMNMSSISCEPQVMARMRAPRRDLIVPTSGYCWAAMPAVSLVASLVREGSRRRLGVGAVLASWAVLDEESSGRLGPDDVPALRVGVGWFCVEAVLVTCGSSMAMPEWKPSELVLVDVTAMVRMVLVGLWDLDRRKDVVENAGGQRNR